GRGARPALCRRPAWRWRNGAGGEDRGCGGRRRGGPCQGHRHREARQRSRAVLWRGAFLVRSAGVRQADLRPAGRPDRARYRDPRRAWSQARDARPCRGDCRRDGRSRHLRPEAQKWRQGARFRQRHGRHAAARALPSLWRGRQEAACGWRGAGSQPGGQLHHLARDGGSFAHRARAQPRAEQAVGRAGPHPRTALGRVAINLISARVMDAATIATWMHGIDVVMREAKDHLVQLDAAIGDGDHGTNMTRGFEAVVQALDADSSSPPGKLLILAGRTLVGTVGGASGPLWGSALRSGGRVLGDQPTFEGMQLVEVLAAALASGKDLGTASVGDKTMVDALEPAVETLRARLSGGASVADALGDAGDAAEAGMRSTIPLQARKGRASYLGERSIGHQDPGATSTALIRRALQRTAAQE